jgi:hypothetical protein
MNKGFCNRCPLSKMLNALVERLYLLLKISLCGTVGISSYKRLVNWRWCRETIEMERTTKIRNVAIARQAFSDS